MKLSPSEISEIGLFPEVRVRTIGDQMKRRAARGEVYDPTLDLCCDSATNTRSNILMSRSLDWTF